MGRNLALDSTDIDIDRIRAKTPGGGETLSFNNAHGINPLPSVAGRSIMAASLPYRNRWPWNAVRVPGR